MFATLHYLPDGTFPCSFLKLTPPYGDSFPRCCMSDLEFDQKWQELRRKAGEEKDPFKLAALLSEMAALARQEQEKAAQDTVSPNDKPPGTPAPKVKKARQRRLVVPGGQPPVTLRPRKGKYSKEDSARYLTLAEAALRDDTPQTKTAEDAPGDDKADPKAV